MESLWPFAMIAAIENWPAFLLSWGVVAVWAAVATLFIDYLGQMMGWWDDK